MTTSMTNPTSPPETVLNPDYIYRANQVSFFNAGDGINQSALIDLASFDEKFPSDGPLWTPEQVSYLEARRESWRDFVLKHYNDQCRRRAEYVPVTVCGPARYPSEKMEKRIDKIMALSGEFSDKAARFFANTHKTLEEMKPLETKLAEIYAGQTKYEAIQGDDPHSIEKLEAKLAGLEKRQEQMKATNKIIRTHKTPEARLIALVAAGWTLENAQELLKPDCFGNIGFASFSLTNNNATIKATRSRLEQLKAKKAAPPLAGWEFEGGEVIANADDDRLQIIFNARPEADMITKLKKSAFRWSPRNKAWQRQLTANAVRAAHMVLD